MLGIPFQGDPGMRTTSLLLCLALMAPPALAETPAVARVEVGNRVSENLPEVPAELIERLDRYQNTRGASFAGWLEDAGTVLSLALLPLRPVGTGAGQAFGMLVLGSPDPQRFHAGMATDFLERIAELASAALSRLLPR